MDLARLMKILVLNSGSSSQKSCLYEVGAELPPDPPPCLWEAKIEWEGDTGSLAIRNSNGARRQERVKITSREQAIEYLISTLWKGEAGAVSSPSEIDVVGHRVVHGGPRYGNPTRITAEVKAAIGSLAEFAPLHNRAELDSMDMVEKLFGPVPQVAVFDTGFHQSMPAAAAVYPGPYEWLSAGIRRYGFHGINYRYCSGRAAQLLGRDLNSLRLAACHLGNGCSLAAIRNGKSIDTTMGFTPLEGLMMGTRSGSVDPGILTYLMRQGAVTAQQLDQTLNTQSGLLGISGKSGDMREILAAMKEGDERAKLAFDIYIHRLRSGIGSMIGVLGGLDALLFTGGVGENSPEVRGETCENFKFLGIRLEMSKNAQSPPDENIAAPESSVPVLIIRAQEDWQIARECWALASRYDS
ncbi:MAG TPA: acetate kinase [Terriglobales bacterium]|nr:acetate kinase [Terriglobales bacterium]